MDTKINNLEHLQTAHCENGVVTSLLKHHGLDFMNEPLTFGIGAGLFYVHVPFLKINNGPAVAFRIMPGNIFKETCKSLGVKMTRRKFSDPKEAQRFLDNKLKEGVPVGCQVGVFNLPYYPKEYRFHFNAHNIIVNGFDGEKYEVSDPVMEEFTYLTPEELEDVRFARGPLAPKGQIYFPTYVPDKSEIDLPKAVKIGIKKTSWWMCQIPFGQMGAAGFRYTAKKIRGWRDELGERNAGLYLGQIVRMQEEIGTGGGGFRFLFAAFLEQASEILGKDVLMNYSGEITKSGDLLRENAVRMAQVYRGRNTSQQAFNEIADAMDEIGQLEKSLFKRIRKEKL